MKIYLISGLGFDNRIFRNLDFGDVEVDYLNWIEPLKNESFKNYATRFSKRINTNSDKIILIGHSLGGIIAQEIAEILPISKIILISSIKSRKELPIHFKIMKPLLLYKLFTKELTMRTIKFWGKNYDYDTLEEQNLVADMVNNHSNNYLQWALRQLSIWKHNSTDCKTEIIQIHGELDKTFPIGLIREPTKIVKDAGHFMVFKKAQLISEIIYTCLNGSIRSETL